MHVAHFVRKKSQLRSSFINNQITHHVRYSPHVIWNHGDDGKGGFAAFDEASLPSLDLSAQGGLRLNLAYLKRLSTGDVSRVLNYLDGNDIRLLHFHYGSDAYMYSEVAARSGRPSVVSFYGYDCSRFPSSLMGFGRYALNRHVFRHVSKVLAMSQDMAQDLLNIGCPAEKLLVHYYGTDASRFRTERAYAEKETVQLLILSNLVPKKGHGMLLNALARLKAEGKENFRLRIVGDGALRGSLEAMVGELGLDRVVTFIGPVGYCSKEMFDEYGRADIFVHPSVVAPDGDKEGIPGTIIEAMSTGLPVVSTIHAGIPHVISHERTGLLVAEHDDLALAQNIAHLVRSRDERERIGRAGQGHALQNLNLHARELELEKIYDSLM